MKRSVLAVVLVGLMTSFASAELLQEWVYTDKTIGGVEYVVNDLKLVLTDGDKWLSTQALVVPSTTAKVYQDGFGNTPPTPPPFAWIGMVPSLEWDTYVSGGTLSTPTTTGLGCNVTGGAIDIGGGAAWTCNTDKVDIAWTGTEAAPTGTLYLARITLKKTAQSGAESWKLRLGYGLTEPHVLRLAGPIVNGRLGYPAEPSTWVLMVCGAMGLLWLRRRS